MSGKTRPVLRITVDDLEAGESEVTMIGAGDYAIIATEPCRLDRVDCYAGGTVVLTLRGHGRRRPKITNATDAGGRTR